MWQSRMPAWEILLWMDWFVLPIKSPMVKKNDVVIFAATKLFRFTTEYLSNHKGGNLPRCLTTHHCWYEDPTSLGPRLASHSLLWNYVDVHCFLLLTLNRSSTSICGKSMKMLFFGKLWDCINATMELFMPTIPSSKHGPFDRQSNGWQSVWAGS